MSEIFLNILGVHSVPRSGSSWLGQIFNSSPDTAYRFQPFFSHAFKGRVDTLSKKADLNLFFEDLLNTTDDFVLQKTNISKNETYFFSKNVSPSVLVYKEVRYHNLIEHLLSSLPNYKCVLLIRNPLTTLNSWKLAPKEFKPEWDFAKEWRYAPSKNQNKVEEYNGFEKWLEFSNMAIYLKKKYPDRVYLVSYSALLQDSMKTVSELFSFINIPLGSSTIQFLNETNTTQNNDPYSVFKIKKSESFDNLELPKSIINEIMLDVKRFNLEQFL